MMMQGDFNRRNGPSWAWIAFWLGFWAWAVAQEICR